MAGRCLVAIVLLAAGAIAAAAGEEVWPMPQWQTTTPAEAKLDEAKLKQARDYALTGGGAGCIVRGGRIVLAWGDRKAVLDLKSTTKSIGMTAVGLALADGKIASLSDKASKYHPSLGVPPQENAKTGWIERITLQHLATQTAGFDKNGGYTKLLFEPGTKYSYSDGGPNWLAECVTLAYRRDLRELLFERVFTPIGIQRSDLSWRENMYREKQIDGVPRREFGAGIHANVDAMARIGLLYLRGGRWGERQLLPAEFVAAVQKVPAEDRGLPVVYQPREMAHAADHYGLLWWNNADGTLAGVPRDAYWSWGLYESFIVVIPSLDVVVARNGKSWKETPHSYEKLVPFLGPICAAAGYVGPGSGVASEEVSDTFSPEREKVSDTTPPPSPVITGIEWAPASSIVRRAEGSDNWPLTWADDDHLYTTYGDGWGFEPKLKRKLSLGFARVIGPADGFRGENIRSATGEQTGDGRSGKKASGLLCVGGVLYAAVRNADGHGRQSQLAWSADHAESWQWADWRFAELGHPVFLNFGKNYAGATDEHVYLYSPDTPDAYRAADRVVLARVPKDRIRQRDAYEFFVRIGEGGRPVWSKAIADRGATLALAGGCNRLDVVYDAPLGRCLMTMRSRGEGGGRDRFSIYDAPEPWGPWTTVFSTGKWDVDPGEVARIPSKWIGRDGRTFWLVFAGNDSFSVRKATLTIAERTAP